MIRAHLLPPQEVLAAALLAAVISAASATASAARTLDVPAYFPTISEALNEALDGDVIEIAPGLYSRASNGEQFPLELRGRRLVFHGAGAWRTILDAGGAARHFRFSEGDSSTLEDAALVGGFASDDGGAIRGDDSFTRIRRVRILNCESREEGNAIAFSRSKATLENVLVTSNGPSGTAVLLEQDLGSRIRRSTFQENGGVALLVRGGSPEISRNVFSRPGAPEGMAAAILIQDTRGECVAFGEGNFFQECGRGDALVITATRSVHDISASEAMRPVELAGSRRGEFSAAIDAGAFSGKAALEMPEDGTRQKKESAGHLGATPNPFSPQT